VGEKLNDKELGFLRLILRSPDRGDGWRSVSSVVWPLVESFTQPDLIEIEPSADGGRVRLSPRGAIVIDYI
jgi:hypothetical protein